MMYMISHSVKFPVTIAVADDRLRFLRREVKPGFDLLCTGLVHVHLVGVIHLQKIRRQIRGYRLQFS